MWESTWEYARCISTDVVRPVWEICEEIDVDAQWTDDLTTEHNTYLIHIMTDYPSESTSSTVFIQFIHAVPLYAMNVLQLLLLLSVNI